MGIKIIHYKIQLNTEDSNGGNEGYKCIRHTEINSKMADINSSSSVITLNVSGLNSPKERQRFSEWIKNKK